MPSESTTINWTKAVNALDIDKLIRLIKKKATASTDGFMSKEHYSKLEGIEAQANNTVLASSTGSSTTSGMTQKAITDALNGKQATLVSGTNIKTVDSLSLLGSGNIKTIHVKQVAVGTNADFPILFAHTSSGDAPSGTASVLTDETDTVGKSTNALLRVNPSTGTIKLGADGATSLSTTQLTIGSRTSSVSGAIASTTKFLVGTTSSYAELTATQLKIGAGTLTATQYSGNAATASTAAALSAAAAPSFTNTAPSGNNTQSFTLTVGGQTTATGITLAKAAYDTYGVVSISSLSTTFVTIESLIETDEGARMNNGASLVGYANSDYSIAEGSTVTDALDDLYSRLGVTDSGSSSSVLTRIIALETGKQDNLVGSGTGQNIKTVDGQNIMGSGNVVSKYVDQAPKSDNKTYPILLGGFTISDAAVPTANQTGKTAGFDGSLNYNPSTNRLGTEKLSVTDSLIVGGGGNTIYGASSSSNVPYVSISGTTITFNTNLVGDTPVTITKTDYGGRAAKAYGDEDGLNIKTNYALKSELLLPTPIIVNSLPSTVADAHKGKFIFVKDTSSTRQNAYTEYIAVQDNGTWKYEPIGSTDVTLDVAYLTEEEIEYIWSQVPFS